MTARAIVTRYWNEQVTPAGDFTVDAYILITDPAHINDGSGLNPRQIVAAGIALSGAAPATWATAIENAVVAACVAQGFTDLTVANTFIPTIA